MPVPNAHAKEILNRILSGDSVDETLDRLAPRSHKTDPLPPRLTATGDHSEKAMQERRNLLEQQGITTDQLAGKLPEIGPEQLSANIENQIGMARIPVGVIGPLRINGTSAAGDFYVPMATSEGALVASYHRGAIVTALSGGVTAACLTESIVRAPCFVFDSLRDVGRFLAWLLPRFDQLQSVVDTTTTHGKLNDLQTTIVGKEVYLLFEFSTGDAGGQNMVTMATEAICQWIESASPLSPQRWYVDGNMSGDKKATAQAFSYARGKKVVAEATIPSRMVRRFLHTTPDEMFRYWQVSVLGGIQSGSIGVQGHFSNGLTALFIACGQDVACISEAAVGITRLDVTCDGDLYASVSLPNLICGTVGGGTHLPTAAECLEMIGCRGNGKARKFSEICAATILCGELSIIGAMAAGDFAQAHQTYGRPQKN